MTFDTIERTAERAAELRREREAAIAAAHEAAVERERRALDYPDAQDVADMLGIVHEIGRDRLADELHDALAAVIRAEHSADRDALPEAATGLCDVLGRMAGAVAADRVRLAELRGPDLFEPERLQ